MANDNGERLIERGSPKVLQQIVISLIEIAPGKTSTNVSFTCPDEISCRGLFDKGRVCLDEHFAKQNAPRLLVPAPARFRP